MFHEAFKLELSNFKDCQWTDYGYHKNEIDPCVEECQYPLFYFSNCQLTCIKWECCQGVLIPEIHHGGGVSLTEDKSRNCHESSGSIGTSLDLVSDPRNVHGIVFLVLGELPEPGHMELATQRDGPIIILFGNWKQHRDSFGFVKLVSMKAIIIHWRWK